MERKIYIRFYLCLALFLALFFINGGKSAEAASINGNVKTIARSSQRDAMWYTYGYLVIYNYDGINIKLVDEHSNVIQEVTTALGGLYQFKNVPIGGPYYVLFEDTKETTFLTEFPQYANRTGGPFTISSDEDYVYFPFEAFAVRTPYPLKLETSVGSFDETDPTKKVNQIFSGEVEYRASDNSYKIGDGIQYADKISNKLGGLPKLTLTSEEIAYGYQHIGWKQVDSDVLLSENQVLDAKADGIQQLSYKAVFSHPTHTVQFLSNTDLGTLTGDVTQSFDGNLSKVTSTPTAIPKEGYDFLGWVSDLSANVITEEKIKADYLTKNVTYYAKYAPKTCSLEVNYVDEAGNKISDSHTLNGPFGQAYSVSPKFIENYELLKVEGEQTGTYSLTTESIAFIYKAAAAKIEPVQITPSTPLAPPTTVLPTTAATSTLPYYNGTKVAQSLPKTGTTEDLLFSSIGFVILSIFLGYLGNRYVFDTKNKNLTL